MDFLKFLKTSHLTRNPQRCTEKKSQIPTREKLNDKPNNIAIAYVAGLFKKLRRILSNHDIPVHFGSSHAIRQKCFVNSKTKLPNTS